MVADPLKPSRGPAPGAPPESPRAVFRVCLHGTPRQWEDRRRRWVGHEKETLVTLLVGRGATLRRWAHSTARKGLVLRFEAQGQRSSVPGMQLGRGTGAGNTGAGAGIAMAPAGTSAGTATGGNGTCDGASGAGVGIGACTAGAGTAGAFSLRSRPLVAQNPATVFMFTRPRDSLPHSVGVGAERNQKHAPAGPREEGRGKAIGEGRGEGREEGELELDVITYFEGEKPTMEMHFEVLEAMVLQNVSTRG